MPLGTEQEVAGDLTGVMVERSESEKRRPDVEAREEPTRRVTIRAGAPKRAIEAGRGGDMMSSPSRPPNAPERRPDDSMSSRRRECLVQVDAERSDEHQIEATMGQET